MGILLYETITGEALFPHDDPQAAKALAAGGKIPRLERLRDLGSGLERVARKALDEHPEGRYRDALELRADLEKYLRNVARPSDTVELGRYVRALFPDVLAADRRAPRAAGTVPLTAALGADALEVVERGADGAGQTSASTEHTPPAGLSDAVDMMEGEATTPELNPPSRVSPPPSVAPNTGPGRISTPPPPARNFEEKTPLMNGPAFIDPLAPPAPPEGAMNRLWAGVRRGAETLHQRLGTVGLGLAAAVLLLAMALGVWAAWTEPEQGQLAVEGGPAGATVYVDGVAVGTVPLQTSVAPGQHQVALRDGARVLAESATVVRSGQVARVQLQGEAQARLRIESDPEGAAVWVGGERLGVTPLALTLAEPTNVEVRADGFAVWQRDFPAEVDSAWWVTLRAPERLRPRRGALRITAAGNYEVWIGGEHRGQTPLYVQLRAGRHRVELRHEGAVRRSRSVMVRAGRERHIDLSSSPAPAEESTTSTSPG